MARNLRGTIKGCGGLEREVLVHLKRYCASKWDTLYNHFAVARGTDIQPVLHRRMRGISK
jgi:hypothetical protein